MSKRTPISTRGAKIRWLQSHDFLCEDFLPEDVENWAAIVKLMKADGLIASNTYSRDVNLASLIAEVRAINPAKLHPSSP